MLLCPIRGAEDSPKCHTASNLALVPDNSLHAYAEEAVDHSPHRGHWPMRACSNQRQGKSLYCDFLKAIWLPCSPQTIQIKRNIVPRESEMDKIKLESSGRKKDAIVMGSCFVEF